MVDRFAADQLIPFAALAEGQSWLIIPCASDHVLTNAWLAGVFLGAKVVVQSHTVSIAGIGYQPQPFKPQAPARS